MASTRPLVKAMIAEPLLLMVERNAKTLDWRCGHALASSKALAA
jgi:hypothetical protein